MAVAKSDPKNGTIIFTGGTGSQGGLNGGFRVRRRHAGPGSLMAANDADERVVAHNETPAQGRGL